MGDFKRLVAWQKANAFALAVHAAFKGTRVHVSPGLRAQILRAVNSIGDNFAEGCSKRSPRALASSADCAYSESKEVENQLIKSRGLRILDRHEFEDLITQCDEVSRLWFGLSRMRTTKDPDPRFGDQEV